MSHTRSHSHGSIPFSWEDKPGVCKIINNNECPLNKGSLKSLNKISSSPSLSPQFPNKNLDSSRKIQEIVPPGKKIPLPPPCRSQPPPPRRSLSGKGFRWQEDPFVVAYKECTKSEKKKKNNNDKLCGKNKKGVGSSSSEKRSKFNFSCRSINDVIDDSYLKLPQHSHIHGARNGSLTLEEDKKRGFNNYDSWL